MNLEKNNINQIFLIGQSGSGKTTIGKKLAKKLSFKFVDTDECITKEMKLSVNEIFQQKGESFFREKEINLINSIVESKKIVISTGGGLPEINDSLDLMKKNGFIVWIKSSPREIEKRLVRSNKGHRPLLFNNNLDLIENLEEQLKKRYDVYSKADLTIKNDYISEIECTEEIMKKIFKI
tara:strand:- start:197 stop:736 length:540 start_codon:yes stop_codon:yes gene_type:complete